jgi:hypothetical protein
MNSGEVAADVIGVHAFEKVATEAIGGGEVTLRLL